MDSNNIILFPSPTRQIPPRNLDDVITNIDSMKLVHVQETIAVIIPMIFQALAASGFDFGIDEESEDPTNLKDGAFIVEAIRSMLCKYYKLHHPFQDVAENLLTIKDDGLLIMNNNIEFNEVND